MNTISELDALYGDSSYDSPLVRIGEWRIFMDEFIPSPRSTALIAKIFAWSPANKKHYFSIPGIDGAWRYEEDRDIPDGIGALVDSCRINKAMLFGNGDFKSLVGEEILKSIHELAALVCAEEGSPNPLETRSLTLKDISGGERVLWSGESRGQKLRVVRNESHVLSFQVESSVPDNWAQLWP